MRLGRAEEAEGRDDPEAYADPIGEAHLSPVPFLVRKYVDRALYLAATACHFHCRFCFRRASPHLGKPGPDTRAFREALDYLAETPQIEEVILSGGDPLTLPNGNLHSLLQGFSALATVKRLRIHTRAPVVAPGRLDEGFLGLLTASPKPVSVVLHLAHPLELRPEVVEAVKKLSDAGATVKSQTVLLNRVNDDPALLAGFYAKQAECGILPIHLHHPDRAPGNKLFRLPIARGLEIYRKTIELSEGPVPGYMLDLPDGSGKTPVAALIAIETQKENGMVRVKYRWERPENWQGLGKAEAFEWWDILEAAT